MFKPNKEQARALVAFAAAAGHQWRSKLRNAWCSDRHLANKRDEYALLRQVRNEAGPNWLHQVKLDDLKRLANPGLEDKVTAVHGSTFDTLYAGQFKSLRTLDGLLLSVDNHGSILIKPGQLDDLVSLLCLAKENGHVS